MATATIAALVVSNFMCSPLKKHRNMFFHLPKSLSTTFLVEICARLYLLSESVAGCNKGVSRHLEQGYPLSPSSIPLISPL